MEQLYYDSRGNYPYAHCRIFRHDLTIIQDALIRYEDRLVKMNANDVLKAVRLLIEEFEMMEKELVLIKEELEE